MRQRRHRALYSSIGVAPFILDPKELLSKRGPDGYLSPSTKDLEIEFFNPFDGSSANIHLKGTLECTPLPPVKYCVLICFRFLQYAH